MSTLDFSRFSWLLLSFSLLVPGLASAQAAPDLENLSTEAYLSMMDGDQLMDAGQKDQALKKYQEAQAQYLKLREQDPTFKDRVVSYRLDVLNEKISLLAPAPEPVATPQTEQPALTPPAGAEDYQRLYLEARATMAEDATRMVRLESRLMEADAKIRESKALLTQRATEYQATRAELIKLKTDSANRLSVLEEESRDFARYNELLKERADKIERENLDLARNRDQLSLQHTQQEADLVDLRTQLEQAAAELVAEKQQTSQGEQRLILERNQLRDDLAVAQRHAEESAEKVATYEARLKDVPLLEESVIELNTRNETQGAELEKLREEFAVSTNLVTETTAKITALETELAPLKDELEKRIFSEQSMQEKFDVLVSETSDSVGQVNTLKKQLAEMQQSMGKTGVEVEVKSELIRQLQENEEALRSELSTIRTERNKSIRLQQEAEDNLTKAEEERWGHRESVKGLEKANKEMENELTTNRKDLEKALADRAALGSEVIALRAQVKEAEQDRKRMNSLQNSETDLEKKLDLVKTERDRLELNLIQERESRQQLKKTVDKQLDAITDRMNEIISLRVKISNLEKEIQQLRKR